MLLGDLKLSLQPGLPPAGGFRADCTNITEGSHVSGQSGDSI